MSEENAGREGNEGEKVIEMTDSFVERFAAGAVVTVAHAKSENSDDGGCENRHSTENERIFNRF